MDRRRRRRNADQEALEEFQRLLVQGLGAFRQARRRPLAEEARNVIQRRRGRRNLVFQQWNAERALGIGPFARAEEEEEEDEEPMIEVEPGELAENEALPRGNLAIAMRSLEFGIWYTVLEIPKRHRLWRLVRPQADDRVGELSWNVYEDYLFHAILANQDQIPRPLVPIIPVWDALEVDFMHFGVHFLPHAFTFPLGFSFHIGRARPIRGNRFWDADNDSWARPLREYIRGGYGADQRVIPGFVDAAISARLDAAIGEFILFHPGTEQELANFLFDFWRARDITLEDRWQPVQFLTVNMAFETWRAYHIFQDGEHPELLRPTDEFTPEYWEGRNEAYFGQHTLAILAEAERIDRFAWFREQVSSFLVMSVHEQFWDQVRVGNRVTRNLRRVKFDVHLERNSHIRQRLHILILIARAILGTLLRFRCSRLYMRYSRWRRRPDIRIRVNTISRRRPHDGGAVETVNFHTYQLLRPETVEAIVNLLTANHSTMEDLRHSPRDWAHCPDILDTNILEFLQRDLVTMFHPQGQSWQRLTPWEFDLPYEQGSDAVIDNPRRVQDLELDRVGIIFEAGPAPFFVGDRLYEDLSLNNWDDVSSLFNPHFALMRSLVASTDPL